MPDDNFFTGSGATGVPIDEASSGFFRLIVETKLNGNNDVNPGTLHSYSAIVPSTTAARTAQADTLFSRNIIRSVPMLHRLLRLPSAKWKSAAIQTEIMNATNQTRGAYIRTVSARYDLQPQLVGAIILTEQRDQSELEDFADWFALAQLGRVRTSVGLGQVTGTTAKIHSLLDDVFDLSNPIPWPTALLADEAININAVAKYIRMVANAGAEIQATGHNDLHARDPRCQPKPPGGTYSNTALRDLSILASPSSSWSTLHDDNLTPSPPSTIKYKSSGAPYTPPSSAEWYEKWYGNYFVRLVATEYNSCPFDPGMLSVGITAFRNMGSASVPDWVYIDDACVSAGTLVPVISCVAGAYGQWASQAFIDCSSSSHI